jgi:hypothetical protein
MLEEEGEKQLAESKSRKTINSTLDPLLERLARDFIDNADLSCRLVQGELSSFTYLYLCEILLGCQHPLITG